MKVIPISSAYKPKFPPRRLKAVMSIRNIGGGVTEHAVVDVVTGQRVVLDAPEAWALHRSLNMEV